MSLDHDEYKAARFLYDKYNVVSFPAPTEIYDLITLDGIRIEIKKVTTIKKTNNHKPYNSNLFSNKLNKEFSFQGPSLTKRQNLSGAFDLFMILFEGIWVFVGQDEALDVIKPQLNPFSPRSIPMKNIKEWVKRKLEIWQDVLMLIAQQRKENSIDKEETC